MKNHGDSRTILALFTSQEDAERALSALIDAGFRPDAIGFLGPGEAREPDHVRKQVAGIGGGAVAGTIAGGLLGAVAASAIPGIGPFITAGTLLPILLGAFTGGATGGTIGSLLTAAGANDQALYFVQEVEAGRSLLSVTTDRVEEARRLLLQSGSMEAADVGRLDLPQPGAAP
jgi:hypothetical protein